ncbi:BON domain-containing protein [Paraburkholderia sp.]|jgi:osmotically-inducible protein OsmY|uniref:BON domain-containing protein n=1 Tax=Paraburkholderia sp. TaxID=1926495 RepID=UPI002F4293A2
MTTLKTITITLLAAAALGAAPYVSAQTDSGASDAAPPSSKKAARAHNHQLEKSVRHALTHTKHLDSSGITILVKGSVVTLEGNVPTDDEIQLAGKVAGGVSGVTSVTNNLSMHEAGN